MRARRGCWRCATTAWGFAAGGRAACAASTSLVGAAASCKLLAASGATCSAASTVLLAQPYVAVCPCSCALVSQVCLCKLCMLFCRWRCCRPESCYRPHCVGGVRPTRGAVRGVTAADSAAACSTALFFSRCCCLQAGVVYSGRYCKVLYEIDNIQ
jgi:hypothetical protein